MIEEKNRKKIKICQMHFANIDSTFLHAFQERTKIINIISFIREKCYDDFNLYLYNKEDFEKLDKKLEENFYHDKSEWLREKMRNELKRR